MRRTTGLVAGRGCEGTSRSDGGAALVDEGIFVQGGHRGIVLNVDVVIVDVCLVMQLLRDCQQTMSQLRAAEYLFDLGVRDMWLYALWMQGCAVDGSGGEHGDGQDGSVATLASV